MIKPSIVRGDVGDGFADGTAVGIFIGKWLLVGIQYYSDGEGTWMAGIVLFNVSFGVWNG